MRVVPHSLLAQVPAIRGLERKLFQLGLKRYLEKEKGHLLSRLEFMREDSYEKSMIVLRSVIEEIFCVRSYCVEMFDVKECQDRVLFEHDVSHFNDVFQFMDENGLGFSVVQSNSVLATTVSGYEISLVDVVDYGFGYLYFMKRDHSCVLRDSLVAVDTDGSQLTVCCVEDRVQRVVDVGVVRIPEVITEAELRPQEELVISAVVSLVTGDRGDVGYIRDEILEMLHEPEDFKVRFETLVRSLVINDKKFVGLYVSVLMKYYDLHVIQSDSRYYKVFFLLCVVAFQYQKRLDIQYTVEPILVALSRDELPYDISYVEMQLYLSFVYENICMGQDFSETVMGVYNLRQWFDTNMYETVHVVSEMLKDITMAVEFPLPYQYLSFVKPLRRVAILIRFSFMPWVHVRFKGFFRDVRRDLKEVCFQYVDSEGVRRYYDSVPRVLGTEINLFVISSLFLEPGG